MSGLRGFPFGMVRSTPWSGTFGAWHLEDYVEVRKLQGKYNADRRISQTEHEADPSAPRIATGAITEDGKWGDNTMTAVRAWVDWKVRKGACSSTSGSEAERNGPNAFSACLTDAGFTSGEIAVLQIAWAAYKSEAARQASLEVTARRACEASGGTWNASSSSCSPPAGAGGGGAPPPSEEMSTGAKIGIVALVALLLVGGYYVVTS